jgi:hypothetical protein
MIENEDCAAAAILPAANDNGPGQAGCRIDAAVLRIARLIGRQMVREEFERLTDANDNREGREGKYLRHGLGFSLT